MSLRMCTDRADLRSSLSNVDVSTDTTFPDLFVVLGEDRFIFHILQKSEIASFVLLLDLCNTFKQRCNFVEALFSSLCCEVLVHIGPLVVFPFSSHLQVSCCIGNLTVLLESLEPDLGMHSLVVCSLLE